MVRRIYIFLLIIFFSRGYSQNLVSNSSYEDTLTCQQWINLGAGIQMVVYPWYRAVKTPDYWCPSTYLNFCGASGVSPNTFAGIRIPRTGVGMAGFAIFTNSREIIGTPLQDTLIQNHIYYVEFYVSPGGNCQLQTDDIGAYLSDSLDPGPVYQYNILPQIENPQGNIINDTLGWTKISGYYTASGNECFVYIGNFKSDSNTTYDTIYSAALNSAYYFLDDVSIVDCTAVGIKENAALQFQLLNNLVGSSLQFTSATKVNRCFIYDMVGNKLKEFVLNQNNSTYTVNVADLSNGMYLLMVEDRNTKRGVRKFVKN